MIRKTIGRLKKRNGTTLVETLATVILLGLMGITMVAGISAIRNAYEKVVRRANEQILLSTTLTEMRNLIRTSTDYQNGRFRSEEGYWFSFSNSDDDGVSDDNGVKVSYYPDQKSPLLKESLLVPKSNGAISQISVEYEKLEKQENGTFMMTNIKVGKKGDTENTLVLDKYVFAGFQR